MSKVEAAWKAAYGTPYSMSKDACIHFTAGYYAAGGTR